MQSDFLMTFLVGLGFVAFMLWPAIHQDAPVDMEKPYHSDVMRKTRAWPSFLFKGIRFAVICLFTWMLFVAGPAGPVVSLVFVTSLGVFVAMARYQRQESRPPCQSQGRIESFKRFVVKAVMYLLSLVCLVAGILGIVGPYLLGDWESMPLVSLLLGGYSLILLVGSVMFFTKTPLVPNLGYTLLALIIPVLLFVILAMTAAGLSP